MWVKICGVRDEVAAEGVVHLAPDAIGLNFYPKSPRSVSLPVAARIAAIARTVQRVGVFVNHPRSQIEDAVAACQLNAVQLHGDESPDFTAHLASVLKDVAIFRAWRFQGSSLADLADYLAACRMNGTSVAACLVDSHVPGVYGGTGAKVPWAELRREYPMSGWPPLILAGGLSPENIAQAVATVQPWGVDVASGVETAPGQKDLERVRRFIEAARNA